MATKAQVRRALAAVGAAWDEAHDTFDSPVGTVWQASDCHSIAAAYDDLLSTPENYDAFVRQIQQGVRPCTEPDCEICAEEPAE